MNFKKKIFIECGSDSLCKSYSEFFFQFRDRLYKYGLHNKSDGGGYMIFVWAGREEFDLSSESRELTMRELSHCSNFDKGVAITFEEKISPPFASGILVYNFHTGENGYGLGVW